MLSWAIIFVHSIIPHHHHDIHHLQGCNHCHGTHPHPNDVQEINDHPDAQDHACHFHVEVLSKVSIDHVFLANSGNVLDQLLPLQNSEQKSYYPDTYYESLFYTRPLRAPPYSV
ncbi:MAG: hypothetical protein V2I54_03955 [Bacteroidales bacterium]|jgi:hypothetical protein|nr:hypothetical protein [Bacteroidales bacterium]